MAQKVVSVKLEAKVDGFTSSMRKAKASLDDLTKPDIQKPGKAFDSMATKAAIGGAALAVGVGKAIKSFADFDAAMSAASAALPDAGAKMSELRELAIVMGKDTQFSATEAAQGITEMAKAGVDATQIMGGGLKGALDLAAAGQLDVGQAGEIAATALNQFNLEGSKLPHVADLYAAAAGKAQGSVTDIANAMKYAGVTANAMGISIEETTGVVGLFASKGIIGEQAGTSFRSMLLSLTSPSKIAAKTMENLGINVYDASGKFIGMQGAAQQLQDKLGPLDEATRNQALGQIFGNESMGAAIALYQAGGAGVADWTSKVNDAGFAADQAAKLTDNLKGDMERLSGSIETVFIEAGSGANDTLRALAQGAGTVVDVIGKIPGPVLLAGTALASLALLVPKGISMFRDYKGQLDTLGLSFDKINAKAPKLATGIRGLQGAMAGLAVASTVGAITNAFTNLEKIDFDPQKIADGAVTLADFNKRMAETNDLGLPVATTLSDFGQVLEATFNPGKGQQIDNFFATLNAGIGIENTSDIEVAAQRFAQMDDVLSALVSSGQGEAAAAMFKQITDAAAAQGINVDQVKAKLPGYAQAMVDAGNASHGAAPKMGEVSENVADIEQKADDAKKALDKLRETIEGFGSPLAAQRAAQRDYADAVRGASDGLKTYTDDLIKHRLESQKLDPGKASKRQKAAAADWAAAQIAAGKALDVTTEAGAKNQAALDGIRDKALKAASSTFDLTHSQELAAAEVAKGRDAFIKAAVAAGMNADKAAELATNLGLVPKDVKTAIGLSGVETTNAQLDKTTGKVTTLDKSSAKPAVKAKVDGATFAAAEARLDTLARGRTATITVNVAGAAAAAAQARRIQQEFADIRGGFASGGAIVGPGTGTSDSIPALLSNGEHVLTAAEVQKAGGQGAIYRLRKLINQGVAKFADGGAVGYATGGAVKAPVDAFYSEYVSGLGNKVTAADIAANRKAIADATNKLRLAEMKLEEDRKKKKRNPRQIAADEVAVAKARDAVTAATTKAANAQAAYNRQQESALSKFGKGVRSGVRNTAAFIANIQKLAARGYVALAQNLANMNNEDAEKIAAQAAGASNATLTGLEQQVTTAAGQQAKLDHIDTITAIIGQARTKNLGARQMAAATGIDLEEILTAAALIKADLSKNKNASKLLADLAKWSKGQLFSVGGAVNGAGTGTSDSIPAWLSNGEHVLTAREVAAAGGHSAIFALRKAILAGGVGYASGGAVGVQGPMSSPRFDYARLASLISNGSTGPTFNAYGQDSEAAVLKAMRKYEFDRMARL